MVLLSANGLRLRFRDGRGIHLDGNLEIRNGSALAVIGGNGTGKSTLLRVLAGLQEPEGGTVRPSRNLRLALVPTDLNDFLFPWYSAEKNLALFSSGGRDAKLENRRHFSAKWAHLLHRDSCDELMPQHVHMLSSGERSTLALLCLLLHPPDLMLLDELFSNASVETGHRMIDLLRGQLANGRGIVFSSHSPDFVNALSGEVLDLEAANPLA